MENICASWIEWTKLTTKDLFRDMIVSNNRSSQLIGPVKGNYPQTSTTFGEILLSPSQLGILSGVFFALFLNYKLKNNNELYKVHTKFMDFAKKLFTWYPMYVLLCLGAFLIQTPIFVCIWTIFKLYRQIILVKLKEKHGEHFKGFLEGTDTVWALEDNAAKSVINIMAIIQGNPNTTASDVLLTFRKRFAEKLLTKPQRQPKMFFKRLMGYGYYYWTDENECFIEDYIRYMECRLRKPSINNTELVELISEQCNKGLPYDHTSSWEVLVGQQPLEGLPSNKKEFPILFRVHHSLGDGVALLRLFLETIADKDKTKKNPWIDYTRRLMNLPDLTIHSENNNRISSPDNEYINRIFCNQFITKRKLYLFLQKLWCLLVAPATIVTQLREQKIDENPLHRSTPLSADKIASWYFESNEENLLNKIKAIKRRISDTKFSDVLLTALSSSLKKHFQVNQLIIPHDITIVIPARVEPEDAKVLKIHNRFSCALQTLPIDINSKSGNFYKRINLIKKQSDKLRNSFDYQINYWIMSFIASIFPEKILRKILNSAQCTMAISNVPGPQNVCKINNFLIKKINFWLPNRITTGIGLSILSYNNKLQMGILADKTVLPHTSDCEFILKNIIQEIHIIDKLTQQGINK